MNRLTLCFLPLIAATLATLAACDESKPASPAKPASAAAQLPAGLILSAAPADPKNVTDAKAAAKSGAPIVIRGRIGGSKAPIVSGRAVFTLMDTALLSCADNPDDACPTPWDYCCESATTIAANAATIQIVDNAGQPLKTDLTSTPTFKPLTELIITGTIALAEDSGALVINATGIYPVPSK